MSTVMIAQGWLLHTGNRHMNFIRNVKIRAMVVWVLLLSTIVWVGVSGATLWFLHHLENSLTLNAEQTG